jgi:hypothetical protein
LAQKPIRGRKQNIGVPTDDDQSRTKVERQGIILSPAFFEDKLAVYQKQKHNLYY